MASPPRRHLKTSTLVLITAGLAVLVMALSVGGVVLVSHKLASQNDAAASATTTASTTPPDTFSGAFKGDLRTLLLARPDAAKRLSFEGWADDGTFSAADEAARTSDPGGVLSWLQDVLGYKQGAWTAWQDGDSHILILLHQFRGPMSANSWVSNNQLGLADSSSGFRPGEKITGVANGLYFVSKATLDDGNFYVTAYFAKTDLVAEVSVFTKAAAEPDKLVAICQAQFARLP